jgi:NAD(P)-dependent dehydrogenase (short-subunit alcohol dehydrogenase family)
MMKGMTKQTPSGISYAGKVVLVTGGASGIGRAMALAFGRAGACVVIADTAVDGGHMTAALIVEAGGKALFVKANVTVAADVEALVEKAVGHYGRIDCAVNGAAVEEEYLPLAEGEDDQFDRIMAVNVKGVWLCMKHQLPLMAAQRSGAIVNTASVAGLVGAPLRAAYAGSKHAVVGLTKSAAAEYGRRGVRVNAVCPGIIRTAMMDRALARRRPEESQRDPGAASLLGRVGEAGEIAAAVLWLLSDAASYVTGHQLTVAGGLTVI